MTDSIFLTLRGQEIVIDDIVMGAAEPDVGIMTRYLDEWTLKDSDGEELDWELTDEEVEAISQAVLKADDGDDDSDDDDWDDKDYNDEGDDE